MPFSQHSHSGQFCLHATDTLEEIVLEAIKKGFQVYGLSEHCPRYRTKDLYPEESHSSPQELNKTFTDYVIEAQRLQNKYKSQIILLIGVESENIYSNSIFEILQLAKDHSIEYCVGSVHHVYEIPIDFDLKTFEIALEKACEKNNLPSSSSMEENLFNSYFDLQFHLFKSIKPMIIGHFDVIRKFKQDFQLTDSNWEKIERNIDFVISYGGLFEINSAAYKVGLRDAYPQRDILKLIIRKGGRFTISDDSHGKNSVGQHYDKLYSYLKEFNIDILYYLDHSGEDDKQLVVKEMKNVLNHPFWKQFQKINVM
nr:15152_t:CDS:1 [Entrophospora candida]